MPCAWGRCGRRLSGRSAAGKGGQPGKGQSDGHKEAGFLGGGVGLGLGGHLPGSTPVPPVPGIQQLSDSRDPG